MPRTCQCQVQVGNNVKCMHQQHKLYQLNIKQSDCDGCGLKITLNADPLEPLAAVNEPLPPPEPPEPEKLTLMEKAKSLGSVLSNPRVINGELVKDRRETCNACPQRSGRRCKLCSCNIYAKTLFAKSKCPLNKWAILHADFVNMYRAKFGQDSEVLEVPEISVEDCKILVESCGSFEHFKKQVEVIL